MHVSSQRIAENLASIRGRMADAAQRAGRRAEDIQLIAVTKYVDASQAAALIDAGCAELGESRPQELWRKADSVRQPEVHWHLIGHLQRNKIRRTLPLVSMIHSGDSLSLLAEIHTQSVSLSLARPVAVLLEVNISGDATKHGFAPAAMRDAIANVDRFPAIRVCGLMTMASREGDLDAARLDFRRLRELREELRPHAPPECKLDELSMGMSGDFEVAIEEGATMVRIGSALFEGIEG